MYGHLSHCSIAFHFVGRFKRAMDRIHGFGHANPNLCPSVETWTIYANGCCDVSRALLVRPNDVTSYNRHHQYRCCCHNGGRDQSSNLPESHCFLCHIHRIPRYVRGISSYNASAIVISIGADISEEFSVYSQTNGAS